MAYDPELYHRQIRAARAVGLRMTAATQEAMVRLLVEYGDRLSREVARGVRTAAEARRTLATVERILDELVQDMARSTRNAITYTSREVAQLHAQAVAAITQAEGILGLGINAPVVSLNVTNSLLARPELSRAFVTIRNNAAAAADRILRQSALEGVSGPQLAMRLRTMVVGADALPQDLLLDRRRIGYAAVRRMGLEPTPENLALVRAEARTVAWRANLIGRTEPMNAQHETRAAAAADSPVVQAIAWELSYRHPKVDLCDTLAEQDLFNLGTGIYDPRVLPPRPHPRCLCRTRDILLPVERWGEERGPAPQLVVDPSELSKMYEFSPSEERQLVATLRTAVARADGRAAA